MKPRIHDAATVEAAKLCTYYPRASVDFQAEHHDAWLKARELLWPLREKDELNTAEVGNRLKDEHIAGLEAEIKRLTEWRSMETAPRDGSYILCWTCYDTYTIEYFLPHQSPLALTGLIGWLPIPEANIPPPNNT